MLHMVEDKSSSMAGMEAALQESARKVMAAIEQKAAFATYK